MKRARLCKFSSYAFCLLVLCCVDLYPQNIRNSDELVYNRGLLHLQLGQFEAAAHLFERMIDNNPDNARAHYGLGRVHLAQNPKSRHARREFERAIALDDSLADAWLYLAKTMAERNFNRYKIRPVINQAFSLRPGWPQAWDFWIATCLNRRGAPALLFRDFRAALEETPNNQTIYDRLISTAMRHYREKDAAAVLSHLYRTYPNNARIARDLLRLMTLAGKHRACFKLMQSMQSDSVLSQTTLSRFKALNHFALTDTSDAVDAYWKAINNLKDRDDAETLADDVRFICSTEEWQKLNSTPIDALAKFYQKFWRSRDPLPSTPINERLVDHLYRLHYVNQFCRRFGDADLSGYDPRRFFCYKDLKPLNWTFGSVKSKETLLHFFNHFYATMRLGDDILKESPSLIARFKRRHIDDMGLTILRFGLPDVEYWNEASGAIPECTTFHYKRNALHPELLLHFVYLPEAGWVVASFPLNIKRHAAIDGNYRTFEDLLTDFQGLEKKINETEGMSLAEKAEHYAKKLQTITAVLSQRTVRNFHFVLTHDQALAQKKQFRIELAPVSFKWQNGKSELDLIYSFDARQLQFKKGRTEKVARAKQKIRFLSLDYTLIEEIERQKDIAMPLQSDLYQKNDYVAIFPFYLSSGSYILQMEIQDNVSTKTGVARTIVEIPDHFSARLSMSDILLFSPLNENKGQFNRGSFLFEPRQLTGFLQSEFISAYLEIYNLIKDAAGSCHYSLDVNLTQRVGDKIESRDISIFSVHAGMENQFVNDRYVVLERPYSDDVLYLRLKKGDLRTGTFELSIRLFDHVSGQELIRTTTLQIY